jgi:hypothetical protein
MIDFIVNGGVKRFRFFRTESLSTLQSEDPGLVTISECLFQLPGKLSTVPSKESSVLCMVFTTAVNDYSLKDRIRYVSV